ncbi:AAA domain-containing protein (plasmid) [Natrinema zhouii]|uniref:DEAD/DEAH box helicase n=1 Tax=Natrinema zhouii TaxID=1710539 RepID=UPI001CFF94C4|nr:AAA domain-containing protein [Natrinema zhouii]UHQ98904.1 AAA domain-containing protein [Natrinema zhouii]
MEGLLDNWRYQTADLFRADISEDDYEPVDIEVAVERAKELTGIEIPSVDRYVIPLFKIDEPILVDQYVFYTPSSGQLRWYDPGFGISGSKRSASCETLGTTEIGQRLRFWLPSYLEEPELPIDDSELPPEQIQPSDRLSDDEQAAFFRDLKGFVRSERESERDSNWETYSEMGLDVAINRNRISGPFISIRGTTGESGDQAYVFQIAVDEDEEDEDEIDLRDDEGLFGGNFCIADTDANNEQFPLEVEILSVDGPNITIQPDWSTVENRPVAEKILSSDETELWFHELLNPIPFERRLTAINEVKRNESKRELLTGQRSVEFNVNRYAIPDPEIELNDYQYQALLWADSTSDVVCIHGPPGTGKTRTLTAYVQHAVAKGESVLVTAHSNQAVDNLLVGDSTPGTPEEDTLHAMAQDSETDLSIARVGNNTRESVVEANYVDRSPKAADVVAATTSGASQFNQNEFDVAVVDEATQASRPASAIVLNCARKLILAGDHKQLSPYSAAEPEDDDHHISLFEYLLERYDDDISVLLRTQYRMNEEIATFPNDAFYNGELKTADQCRNWTVDDLKPIMGIDIAGDEQRQTHGNSLYNYEEAQAVAKQVKLLVQNDLDPSDIGVITAYSGQVGKVINQVNQLDIDNPRRVDVDTVDSFQGGEREAIIVSFVRSNDDGHSGFLEFPEEGPRRLNVALTRARKRLVLIGNWDTLGTVAPHRSPDESCAYLYASLADRLQSQERMLSIGE